MISGNDSSNTDSDIEETTEEGIEGEQKAKKIKPVEKEVMGMEQYLESILYLLARPVSVKELAELTQVKTETIDTIAMQLVTRYREDEAPYTIERIETSSGINYELHLDLKAMQLLGDYDFVTKEELPAKYYAFMSMVMYLEYVKKKKITKQTLEKAKLEDIDKSILILIQHGFLERKEIKKAAPKQESSELAPSESNINVVKEKTEEVVVDKPIEIETVLKEKKSSKKRKKTKEEDATDKEPQKGKSEVIDDSEYITTPRFLRRMGLPSDPEMVRQLLQEKTISYAMKQSGIDG